MAALSRFVGVRMARELDEQIRQTARRKDTTVSAVIRRALENGLRFE
jgi:hypothetical protein